MPLTDNEYCNEFVILPGFPRLESPVIVSVKFSGPGKFWKSKSKVLEFARQWCGRNDRRRIIVKSVQIATCDSDEHILQYGCCYHAIYIYIYIYMVGNCCLSLYLYIAGLRQGPEKMLLGSWKSRGIFFVTVGTVYCCIVSPSYQRWRQSGCEIADEMISEIHYSQEWT